MFGGFPLSAQLVRREICDHSPPATNTRAITHANTRTSIYAEKHLQARRVQVQKALLVFVVYDERKGCTRQLGANRGGKQQKP